MRVDNEGEIAVWLAIAGVVAVGFAVASFWFFRSPQFDRKTWAGSALLAAWVVGVGVKLHLDSNVKTTAVDSLPSIAWPLSGAPTAAAPVVAPATAVPPVASLVSGLEQRLAEQPDDANGWALLAQSYAFMGNADGVEKAVAKAVALGADEQALRDRVNQARRDPHPGFTAGG